jgi:membrane peptidoglycan carboxypeptidase
MRRRRRRLWRGDDGAADAQPKPRRSRLRRGCGRILLLGGILALALGAAGIYEAETSRVQAWYFTKQAADLSYELVEGPSPLTVRAPRGPYDTRVGYTRIPAFVQRFDSLGFDLTAQARPGPGFVRVMELGAYPIYDTKTAVGLTVLDRHGAPLVEERYPAKAFAAFDSIPDILWRSLLFIESRRFLDEGRPQRNPAVEWVRLVRSVGELGLRELGLRRSVSGASTPATQLEKFRHSDQGLTLSPRDKLRQMLTASLRAYRQGPNTLEARRQTVTAYLNSVPLAAQLGHGEVIGTADGLWAWYGAEVAEVNELLRAEPTDSAGRVAQAHAYRKALSLLLAHRRPSYYLTRPEGRAELGDLTDAYLGLLARERVIPRWLADEARRARSEVRVLERAPALPPPSFTERKAATLVRTQLLSLTGVPGLYDLDRLDLAAVSEVDGAWHAAVTEVLSSMASPAFLAANGFTDFRLLDVGDPTKVLYSVTLLERTPLGNAVRVQTDNFEGPLSLAGASRLELGSTAKLRTLVTYLEVVEELHQRLSALPPDSLAELPVVEADRLTRWAVEYLTANRSASVPDMLGASMERSYSASPAERFVTGGGTQTFTNFDNEHDRGVLTVLEAFRHSVNLPFVRIMRDVVAYEMFKGGTARVLEDEADPARQEYLTRFADVEGARFVRQFFAKYRGKGGPEVFETLVAERRLGSRRLAWAFRAVAPGADQERFADFVRENVPDESISDATLEDLYRRTDPSRQTLSDLGFLARIHPLELWVASHVLHNPSATLAEVLEGSAQARIEVYGWLFRTRRRGAQDDRIRTILEMEAFQEILRRWRRVGYPFENIVPSIGTAIGSSGDRPLALAELAGLIVSGGVRHPMRPIAELRLGEGTPYEARFRRRPREPERVLSEEVAAAARDAMVDVVLQGTGRRALGSLVAADGTVLQVGGKTGTGDNRFRTFAPGGALVSERVVNRTSTLVFFAGHRYFGVVSAYVPGPDAVRYRFTSALPAQLLRVLGRRLEGLEPPGPLDPEATATPPALPGEG